MKAMRTSTKECRELANSLNIDFYAKDEHKLNGKVYIKYNGEYIEFKSNTEALEWMLFNDELFK